MTARLVAAGGFDAAGSPEPLVDVVVALHDLSRPVARTVRSVFALPGDDVADGRLRVTVACHELDASDVAAVLPDELRRSVRLLEVRDGLGSP